MLFIELLKYVLDREVIFFAMICHVGVKTELFSFQIYVNGQTLASGYLHPPQLDVQKLFTLPQHGRLYRTGDSSYMLNEGTIEICGRCEPMVKIRCYSFEIQVHLFTDTVFLQSFSFLSFYNNMVLDYRLIVSDEIGSCQTTAVVYFNVLSQHFSGRIEEIYEDPFKDNCFYVEDIITGDKTILPFLKYAVQ
jgi:hypothetical protein